MLSCHRLVLLPYTAKSSSHFTYQLNTFLRAASHVGVTTLFTHFVIVDTDRSITRRLPCQSCPPLQHLPPHQAALPSQHPPTVLSPVFCAPSEFLALRNQHHPPLRVRPLVQVILTGVSSRGTLQLQDADRHRDRRAAGRRR